MDSPSGDDMMCVMRKDDAVVARDDNGIEESTQNDIPGCELHARRCCQIDELLQSAYCGCQVDKKVPCRTHYEPPTDSRPWCLRTHSKAWPWRASDDKELFGSSGYVLPPLPVLPSASVPDRTRESRATVGGKRVKGDDSSM